MVRLCEILARAAAARERGDSNTRTFASSAGVSRAGCARAGSVVGARPGAAARRVFYKLRLTAGSGGGAQRVHLVAVGDELRLRDESLARAAGARERRSLLPPPILVNFVPKQPLRPVVLARSASSAVVAAAGGGAVRGSVVPSGAIVPFGGVPIAPASYQHPPTVPGPLGTLHLNPRPLH